MNKNRLKAMLIDAEAELREAETQIMHLRQVVAGLKGLLGDDLHVDIRADEIIPRAEALGPARPAAVVAADDATKMDALDAFRAAIKKHPNRGFTVNSLWFEIEPLLRSGYAVPKNAVNAAARRLAADPNEPIKRLPDGTYIYTEREIDHLARTLNQITADFSNAADNGVRGISASRAAEPARKTVAQTFYALRPSRLPTEQPGSADTE